MLLFLISYFFKRVLAHLCDYVVRILRGQFIRLLSAAVVHDQVTPAAISHSKDSVISTSGSKVKNISFTKCNIDLCQSQICYCHGHCYNPRENYIRKG